jgi:hypothetical protein
MLSCDKCRKDKQRCALVTPAVVDSDTKSVFLSTVHGQTIVRVAKRRVFLAQSQSLQIEKQGVPLTHMPTQLLIALRPVCKITVSLLQAQKTKSRRPR